MTGREGAETEQEYRLTPLGQLSSTLYSVSKFPLEGRSPDSQGGQFPSGEERGGLGLRSNTRFAWEGS